MTVVKANYRWLLNEREPQIMVQAIQKLGIQEGPGALNNNIILGWASEIKGDLGMAYANDSTPWCGLFVGICAKRAGIKLPPVAVRAKAWAAWGNSARDPMFGDVLVFERPGGGHVGLYVGEDDTCYHVLGGNQGDAVTVARIEKSRLYASRRTPWKIAKPAGVRKIYLTPSGTIAQNMAETKSAGAKDAGKVSKNEA